MGAVVEEAAVVEAGVVVPVIELFTACCNKLAGSVAAAVVVFVPNRALATCDCSAASLIRTRSAGEAFCSADCTEADESVVAIAGDAALDTNCSTLAKPGLAELTELMPIYIGSGAQFSSSDDRGRFLL